MARPRRVERSRRLLKYRLPVIIEALDKLGPPRAIHRINSDDQSGPLLVNLAADVASSCALIINDCTQSRKVAFNPRNCWKKIASPAGPLVPDMFEEVPATPETAASILSKTDPRWWTDFANTVEHKFVVLAKHTGFVRIILRTFETSETVTKIEAILNDKSKTPEKQSELVSLFSNGGEITEDIIAIAHFIAENKPMTDTLWLSIIQNKIPGKWNRWRANDKSNTYNEDTIRKLRSVLHREDRKVAGWIKDNAGCVHPCINSYSDISGVERDDTYGVHRARNELYFCLSEGKEQFFQPHFSLTHTEGSWKEWIDQGQSDSAQYWAKTSS